MFKKIKLPLIFLLFISVIIGFFTIPDAVYQDRFSYYDSLQIPFYEDEVFEKIKRIEITESWLKTSQTPSTYNVSYKPSDDGKILIRTAPDGHNQTIKFSYSYDKDDRRIKYLTYDINESNNNVSKKFHSLLYPSSAHMGRNPAELSAHFEVDYSEAHYFEKLLGKWKYIIMGERLLSKELNSIIAKLSPAMITSINEGYKNLK